jgi:hypothetical protein
MHIIKKLNSFDFFFPVTKYPCAQCWLFNRITIKSKSFEEKIPALYLYKSKKSDVYIFFQTRREIQSKTLTNTHTQGNGFFFFVDSTGLCLCVNIRPAEKRRKKKSLPAGPRHRIQFLPRPSFFYFLFIFIICCRRHRSIVEIHKMCCEQQQAAHRQKKGKRNEYIGYISLGD